MVASYRPSTARSAPYSHPVAAAAAVEVEASLARPPTPPPSEAAVTPPGTDRGSRSLASGRQLSTSQPVKVIGGKPNSKGASYINNEESANVEDGCDEVAKGGNDVEAMNGNGGVSLDGRSSEVLTLASGRQLSASQPIIDIGSEPNSDGASHTDSDKYTQSSATSEGGSDEVAKGGNDNAGEAVITTATVNGNGGVSLDGGSSGALSLGSGRQLGASHPIGSARFVTTVSGAGVGVNDAYGIDPSKPLVAQVGYLGDRYMEWVHIPEVTAEPLRFFGNPVMEAMSRTKWWAVPLVWLPIALWALGRGMHTLGAGSGFASASNHGAATECGGQSDAYSEFASNHGAASECSGQSDAWVGNHSSGDKYRANHGFACGSNSYLSDGFGGNQSSSCEYSASFNRSAGGEFSVAHGLPLGSDGQLDALFGRLLGGATSTLASAGSMHPVDVAAATAVFVFGWFFWGFMEYAFHRFVFHGEPRGRAGITLHFILHGCHHKAPMDGLRLVFPPAASAPIIYGMGHVYRYVMPSEGLACFAFAGCLMGYVAYDCTHYFLHHASFGWNRRLSRLKSTHMAHHYKVHNVRV